jgi:hypothetical protein
MGFIISMKGIIVDPLKVEEITQFHPPRRIQQLQILQGKLNFLQRFVPNYANIMKGFMRILKKGVPICWGEAKNLSFDALKKALVSNPLMIPLDYNQYFLLYLVEVYWHRGRPRVQCSRVHQQIPN